jgi:hypothetical protein
MSHPQQGKATRREWDLSRPDAKRLDMPARLGDDDPRCGPASLQRFAGEDLTVSRGQHTLTTTDSNRSPADASSTCAACAGMF